jgi:hypothetical protein
LVYSFEIWWEWALLCPFSVVFMFYVRHLLVEKQRFDFMAIRQCA